MMDGLLMEEMKLGKTQVRVKGLNVNLFLYVFRLRTSEVELKRENANRASSDPGLPRAVCCGGDNKLLSSVS
jgi:hypothetical protein